MSDQLQLFSKLKTFVGFGPQDEENLKKAGPLLEKHFSSIADGFYSTINEHPEAAKHIEGRVDSLKKTHFQWMQSLFAGEYEEQYFESRWRIGMAHVVHGIEPFWMESVMNLIRTSTLEALIEETGSAQEAGELYSSLLRVLDLDALIVNLSYAEDRLDRLTEFTGMSRSLIENIIKLPRLPEEMVS